MKKLNSKAVSTVLGSILFLIISIAVISTLIVAFYQYNESSNQALATEQARTQEKLILVKLETETIDSNEYITKVLVSNNGTITSRIKAIYINDEFKWNPSLDSALNPTTYINAKEALWIQLPPATILYEETSYLAMTTERGSKTIEQEGKLKNPENKPPTDNPRPSFGPLRLDFEHFYYTECDSQGNFDVNSWKPGWTIEQGARPVVWKIRVENVCNKPILLSKYSCFTTMPNSQSIKQSPWYFEPTKTEGGNSNGLLLTVGQKADLVYIWDTSSGTTPQTMYSEVCQLKVLLTFFGSFQEAVGTKPFGQTIPFEAILVRPPLLEIQAAPTIIASSSTMVSTITITTRNLYGDPEPNQQVSLSTTLGTLTYSTTTGKSLTVTTNSLGIATAQLSPEATTGTAIITATWTDQTKTTNVHIVNSITITPPTATITAGLTQSYTATASDGLGNSWDATNQVIWSIDPLAGGSWVQSTGTYTSAKAGTWTVRATLDTVSGSSSLTVNHASATRITIDPISTTLTAGQSQAYTATAYDSFSNTWSVTSSTTWSIDTSAGGFWNGATYTSSKAGTWTVRATYSSLTATASLTVNPGSLHHIVVTPSSSTIIAGNSQTFTCTAYDSQDNNLGTVTASWSITIDAGGSWNSNTYTSSKAGLWTITATYLGQTGTASLTVNTGSLDHIIITPSSATLTAGQSQAFTATSYDSQNNDLGIVTASWNINEEAGGSWNNNVYNSQYAGTWTITATYNTKINTAVVTVNAGSLDHIVITPANPTVIAGDTQTFTCTTYDSESNNLGIVDAAWSIIPAAGGSWASNTYTSQYAGSWIVTATYNTLTTTTTLTVNSDTLDHIIITPLNSSIVAGTSQNFTCTAYDSQNNNLGIVTSSTTWSIGTTAAGTWEQSTGTYTSQTSGNWTITATYNDKTTTTTLVVTAGDFDHFTISGQPTSTTAGVTFNNIIVTAYDKQNNIKTDYNGQVYFTSTDTQAILPYTSDNKYTFNIDDKGTHTFSDFTLKTTPSQTITITTGTISAATDPIALTPSTVNTIIITPSTTSMTAGDTKTYTANSYDAYNNLIGDISSLSTWSINSEAGGSWSNNIYTSQKSGTWTITATYLEKSNTAILTINIGSVDYITVSPATPSIIAGATQAFTATSFDSQNNQIGIVSSLSLWQITNGAGGSWDINTYTSQYAGEWTVTATYSGKTATTTLTVNVGAPHHIVMSPSTATILAGDSQTFTATSYDDQNNIIADVSLSASWSINSTAGGSWSNNIYTSANAGTWTVTATLDTIHSSASLTVNANSNSLDHITISPTEASIIAGDSQIYSARVFDIYGNDLGSVTSSATFTVNNTAISGNVVSNTVAGLYIITASYDGKSVTTTLTVITGSLDHIIISPAEASIIANSSQTYSARAFDIYGNDLGSVTKLVNWNINSGPGTYIWTDNSVQVNNPGIWTVTASYSNVPDATATLTVTNPVTGG